MLPGKDQRRTYLQNVAEGAGIGYEETFVLETVGGFRRTTLVRGLGGTVIDLLQADEQSVAPYISN